MDTFVDNYNRHWKINQFIDSGAFGKVSSCEQIKFNNDESLIKHYVVKIEKINRKSAETEKRIYQKIKSRSKRDEFADERKLLYVPLPILYGHSYSSTHQYLVLNKFRYTLESYMHWRGIANLSHRRTFKIAYQMVNALEFLHNLKIAHLDIKSDNIAFDTIDYPYLIDFGIADTIDDTKRYHTVSTIRYSGIDAHKGFVTRRTDLENLLFCMFKWINRSSLPWNRMHNKQEILAQKESLKANGYAKIINNLALSIDRQQHIEEIVNHLTSLDMHGIPNYNLIRKNLIYLSVSNEAYNIMKGM